MKRRLIARAALAAALVAPLACGNAKEESAPPAASRAARDAAPASPVPSHPAANPEEKPMRKPNRLAKEKSPYLLQHAHNPVDWFPWGKEAFEKAKKEGKPVFLSVGYSSCHWCHVMRRESFEDERIAKLLNDHFVCIKVDREELPDVDSLYMTAVQMMTGRGGWPMSVVMLPDGRPFFGGTYFPPYEKGGRSGFADIMAELSTAYQNRRAEVEDAANRLAEALRQHETAGQEGKGGAIGDSLLPEIIDSLASRFDAVHGGFGSAPKFPPHTSFPALFAGGERGVKMALHTLDKMALGGVHDHAGGGFHRYATDHLWLLPHFEKMLYDNGLLLAAYADGYAASQNEIYRAVAAGIVAWLDREMTHEGGAFYSALDADTDHHEGATYVWKRSEIMEIMGEAEGKIFCEAYNVKEEGNFRDEATGRITGENILHLSRPLAAGELPRMAAARTKLMTARMKRAQPGLDDKILVSWNVLAVSGLVRAGKAFSEPSYTARAERAVEFLLKNLRDRKGNLLRRWREGEAAIPAYLEDYAYFADALLDLHAATKKDAYLRDARALADAMLRDFWDEAGGGFFMTGAHHDALLIRQKDPFDGATPSANGVAARTLLRLAEATGEKKYTERGRATIEAFSEAVRRMPSALTTLAMAAETDKRMTDDRLSDTRHPTSDIRHQASAEKHPVKASLHLPKTKFKAGEAFEARVRLEIAPKWHVNSASPRDPSLIATALSVQGGGFETAGAVKNPPAREAKLSFSDAPLSVYEGEVWFTLPLRARKGAAPGAQTLEIAVRYQACDDARCLLPETLTLRAETGVGQ